MTEAVIIQKPVWFLYDNGLRHERVKYLPNNRVKNMNGINTTLNMKYFTEYYKI